MSGAEERHMVAWNYILPQDISSDYIIAPLNNTQIDILKRAGAHPLRNHTLPDMIHNIK